MLVPPVTLDPLHIVGDVRWESVNQLGSPTYDPALPTSDTVIYSAPEASALAQHAQLAAIQNANNYTWYLLGTFPN